MSDQGSQSSESQSGEGQSSEGQGQLRMLQLYLKDSSFESPHTPSVFGEPWKPEFQLDINTRSNRLADDRFEVVLSATLKATIEGGRTAFIVEVQHAGVFQVVGIADAALQRVLGTVCPATLFPYVRETVDSLVVKGGFPAVHLAPVNFDALFAEAVRKQQAASGDTRH